MKKFLLPLWVLFCGGCINTVQNGAVCFTFDDFGGEGWLKADAIFKKYNAHATFFISGAIDQERIDVMKKLQSAGHTVGLHTVKHANATPLTDMTIEDYFNQQVKPQLDVCKANGIEIKAFAYPNNRRTEETDAEMFKYFDYVRAGYGTPDKSVVYIPIAETGKKMVLRGGGIGDYYKSKLENLTAILDEAADKNMFIVFFSHRIMPGASGIDMPTELLEALLKHASKRKMKIIGAKEIPALTNKK